MEQPVLTTARLVLRPFVPDDAPRVRELAGAYEIALNTALIPHPYPAGAAEAWIATHAEGRARGHDLNYAITQSADGVLVGAVGLGIDQVNTMAEIGYWLGVPFWGRGLMSEAVRAVLELAFGTLGLNRVYAMHYGRNPASGRVMQKAGMRYEGTLRQHLLKWGEYQDVVYYGVLRSEWEELQTRS